MVMVDCSGGSELLCGNKRAAPWFLSSITVYYYRLISSSVVEANPDPWYPATPGTPSRYPGTQVPTGKCNPAQRWWLPEGRTVSEGDAALANPQASRVAGSKNKPIRVERKGGGTLMIASVLYATYRSANAAPLDCDV